MKFSVFTVMAPDTTPEQMIHYLKETGYDGVEWRFAKMPEELKQETPSFWRNNLCTISPDCTDQELEELSKLTKANEIEVISVTPYVKAGKMKEVERVLQVAKKLDAKAIRVGVPSYDRTQNYHELYQQTISDLKEVEQMCKQYGIKGLIETHHGNIASSASLAYRIVSHFDPEHIGVLYDPGNMVFEGFECYKMGMELLGEYLAHVHVKNGFWEVKKEHEDGRVEWGVQMAPVEKGMVDWKQVLADLKAVGYDGTIGMEDFSGVYGTKEAMQHNIDWVKKLWNEL